MKLVEGFDSNYRYVLVAARRARQIQNGARPSVEPHSRKPCRIAEEELQAGMVKWEIPAAGSAGALEPASERHEERVGGEADD
jgi:DNA-directed RNA polymerase subunit omega